MTTPYTIPLINAQQSIQIALGGIVYTLVVKWNTKANSWTLDIQDQSENDIVTGIALVTGCDLLEQYAYLEIGGSLVCQTNGDANAIPTYQNLGVDSQLYFVTEP